MSDSDDDIDFGKKKKKKAAIVVNDNDDDDDDDLEVKDSNGIADDDSDEDEMDFSKMKKKKKQPASDAAAGSRHRGAIVDDDDDDDDDDEDDDDDGGDGEGGGSGHAKKKASAIIDSDEEEEEVDDVAAAKASTDDDAPYTETWHDSDRDYAYDELVKRVFHLLRADRPELSGARKRYTMKPPQVCREGTKKTVWLNFADMCKAMGRPIDHVVQYVLAELGSTGSVDASKRLTMRGRFQPKMIENVVRKYISDYVTCRTCKSPETTLQKQNRLYFVVCTSCGSSRTVQTVKRGYEAQTEKRRLQRARAGANK